MRGRKKNSCGLSSGLNTVGLGGLWNWLTEGEPIGDLSHIDWDGREVTIIPDSDVFSRVDLLRAVYALGRELQTLGGNVYATLRRYRSRPASKLGLMIILSVAATWIR